MRVKIFAVAMAIVFICGPAMAEEKKRKPSDIEKGFMLFNALKKTVEATGDVSPKNERAFGRSVSKEVFLRFGPMTDNGGLNRYINLVGQTVVQSFGDKKRKYRFAVIKNGAINAFAAPGGYIFITTGLLRTIGNEAELAGVLAHEIAHIVKEHTLGTIKRQSGLSGLAELSAVAMDKDPNEYSKIVNMTTEILFTRGLDQKLEYEADSVGMKYAARAGYDSAGLYTFLKKLKSAEGKNSSIFFSTHPDTGSRIKKLERKLKKPGAGGEVLKERFARIVK
ncbi:hypothetical protein MNBD_NITROSPINAE02-1568 [hydrothermal vent metagenome]|uniref:Peptidase M48 domain-containing protein n=1 Tax=hydrothermal vent metagenome TaxID=652676 RepID=A0A3B1BYI4_9ZZZZ